MASALVALVTQASTPPYSWEPQNSGVTARLRGVSAVSDRVAWASGAKGTVLRTADGGATWRKLSVPDADQLDFRDIDALNERTAYILSIGNGASSRIYKTTDAGTNWTLQFTNADPKGFFDAMAFWSERSGLVIGDSIEGRFEILRTMDAGAHWLRLPSDKLPPALPNEGAFAGSGTNVAVLPGGEAWIGTGAAARCRVLHTKDYGDTWTIADTPVACSASAGIFSIVFRNPKQGVIVGGDYHKEDQAIDNAAVTFDGGATWTPLSGLTGFRSVVAHDPGATRTWVAVGPRGADLTTNDGAAWVSIPGDGYHAFSFAAHGRAGWGVGEGGRIGKLTR